MPISYWWWLVAIGLAVAELFTGTFYLLVIALGCAFGGVAAFMGFGLATQLLVAAVVMVLGFVGLRFSGIGRLKSVRPDRNPDVILDVGGTVDVEQWDSERQTRVRYRGAMWSVELSPEAGADAGSPGSYRIERVKGSTLIVTPN